MEMNHMATLDILKALGDETRLRIVNILFEVDEMCGCEVEALLGLSQSNASRHLSRLRGCGLISGERRGQWIHFSLTQRYRENGGFVVEVLKAARAETPALQTDLDRLAAYRCCSDGCATIREQIDNVTTYLQGGTQ
jgi:ArsR family transcriptional regulator, arsenate/arsenite/antimonite-responsive transcriptional repressor